VQRFLCVWLLGLGVAAPGCIDPGDFLYAWDQRTVVCSEPIDDLTTGVDPDFINDMFDRAAERGQVATLHAHIPGETISPSWLETVLNRADDDGLELLTYADLVTGPPRAGVALAFDDSAIDEWYELRDQLAEHHAHVTFFVTRWQTSWSDAGKAKLAELVALGHSVEPHSVNHIHARDYVRDHGLDAYIADEVVPSIDEMRAAGYSTTVFAYPFGETSPEINAAVLQHIGRVRVSPGSCPY
jgi:peptidoglycan/xylan/chitin deacetylase (PgdA/CDA1 family)